MENKWFWYENQMFWLYNQIITPNKFCFAIKWFLNSQGVALTLTLTLGLGTN